MHLLSQTGNRPLPLFFLSQSGGSGNWTGERLDVRICLDLDTFARAGQVSERALSERRAAARVPGDRNRDERRAASRVPHL